MTAVTTITLESSTGDSVVVSAPDDSFFESDIVLRTDPDSIYDVGFTARTSSGAFEPGGRIIGDEIPIRQVQLPFLLSQASRPRFQRLWGTPGNFRKVKFHYDGISGRRTLVLRLAKEIKYTIEDGFDAAVDDTVYAVVTALAVNPFFEGAETVASWTNTTSGCTLKIVAGPGTFSLRVGGQTTSPITFPTSAAAVRGALAALSTVGGAGNVTATMVQSSENSAILAISFAAGVNAGSFTGDPTNLGNTNLSLVDWFGNKSLTVTINGLSASNVGYFPVWNPTDQPLWLEWTLDPGCIWGIPDFGFGQERRWGRTVGQDSARMIYTPTPAIAKTMSVMSDPFMDTYVCADLSNFAGLMNGVEPLYPVPPYTGTAASPILLPVECRGPAGAKATLRQRRFWSAESGLEAP